MTTFARLSTAVLAAVLTIFIIAPPATAQYRAGIQGTVTDAAGGIVPGANVVRTSQETNVERTPTNTDEGVCTITGLAPGAYKLPVEKTGFSRKILSNVRIGAEQMQSVSVQLEIGQTSESTEVRIVANNHSAENGRNSGAQVMGVSILFAT